MKKQNPRLFRFGVFTIILTVVVFGIVILANVLFQSLPSSVRVLDISEQQYSKLSDESIRLVKNLKEDVTVYVLRQNGTEPSSQDTRTVSMMVNHYDELSDHLTVRYIDPNEYPNLRNKYNISGTVYYYSVIVESASRARYVPFLCEYPKQGIFVEYVDYESYNSSNGTYDTERVFEGEKAISSAIDFVTKEKLPVMA